MVLQEGREICVILPLPIRVRDMIISWQQVVDMVSVYFRC